MSKDFQFFRDNFDTLCKQYHGKYIAIKNETVITTAQSFSSALKEAAKTEKLGTFIVQHCGNGPESYSHAFQSNVSFVDTNKEKQA